VAAVNLKSVSDLKLKTDTARRNHCTNTLGCSTPIIGINQQITPQGAQMNRLTKLASLFVSVFFICSPAMAEKSIQMDLNAVYGPTSFHTQGAVEFAELVDQYSQGSVKIKVHPGGALGFKGQELLNVVKHGMVAMSDILMGVVAGSSHEFGISSLPRLVNSFDEAAMLYKETKPIYEKAAAKWNQKLLYAAPWPPSGLVTKGPINTAADLKGIKIRTYDKNGAEFLKALGASPVSLPWGEVYSSLQTSVIEAVLTSAESSKNGKFWEVLSDFKSINYAYPLNMVTINMDYWKGLSKDQQEAVLKAAAEIEKRQWKASEERTIEALSVIKEKGIQVSEQEDSALTQELDKAAGQIVSEYLSGADADTKAVVSKFVK
jgi:TRAP-type transport system periplasmic protein